MQERVNAQYDPRGVANLILDEADQLGFEITNLALQKLLYFVHGMFLVGHKRPLVSGYFEAWKYGPVHPVAYKAFKLSTDKPITFRAQARDIHTGKLIDIPNPDDPNIKILVQKVLGAYGGLSPSRLVEISHAKNSPWNMIVDKARTGIAIGLKIPDHVILRQFNKHKVSIGAVYTAEEPSEDEPFSDDDLGDAGLIGGSR